MSCQIVQKLWGHEKIIVNNYLNFDNLECVKCHKIFNCKRAKKRHLIETKCGKSQNSNTNTNTSWNKQLTFDSKVEVKKDAKYVIANKAIPEVTLVRHQLKPSSDKSYPYQSLPLTHTKKTIVYLDDRLQICQDLLSKQRLEKPVVQQTKPSGPDKDGFRTVSSKKTVTKKTNY